MPHLEIKQIGAFQSVKLDGVEIGDALEGIDLGFNADGQTSIMLRISLSDIEIDSLGTINVDHIVNIPESGRKLLVQLGWTPPASGGTTYTTPKPAVCTCTHAIYGFDRASQHRPHCPMFEIDNQSPDYHG